MILLALGTSLKAGSPYVSPYCFSPIPTLLGTAWNAWAGGYYHLPNPEVRFILR